MHILEHQDGNQCCPNLNVQGPIAQPAEPLCIRTYTHRGVTGKAFDSCLNMLEHFFRDLTQHRLRRGAFRDVEELTTAIDDYMGRQNDKLKPSI